MDTPDRKPLSNSAQRVQETLKGLGLSLQVVEFPDSTRTSQEAAQAIGCAVNQIAKSLIFKTQRTQRPILVVVSESNRVNESWISKLLGEKIEKADADFVRLHTGFVIGGVPPLGHAQSIETFIDRDLLDFKAMWAAAGSPHAVFRLTGEELVAATGGLVISVTGHE